mmetsp:Transcript_49477/g.142347  ORF Transcript_49477/g.142347 Transcript_49477/m.142347 type:complete len:202 (-) Transcript_49477:1460-2065(-)
MQCAGTVHEEPKVKRQSQRVPGAVLRSQMTRPRSVSTTMPVPANSTSGIPSMARGTDTATLTRARANFSSTGLHPLADRVLPPLAGAAMWWPPSPSPSSLSSPTFATAGRGGGGDGDGRVLQAPRCGTSRVVSCMGNHVRSMRTMATECCAGLPRFVYRTGTLAASGYPARASSNASKLLVGRPPTSVTREPVGMPARPKR